MKQPKYCSMYICPTDGESPEEILNEVAQASGLTDNVRSILHIDGGIEGQILDARSAIGIEAARDSKAIITVTYSEDHAFVHLTKEAEKYIAAYLGQGISPKAQPSHVQSR